MSSILSITQTVLISKHQQLEHGNCQGSRNGDSHEKDLLTSAPLTHSWNKYKGLQKHVQHYYGASQ